MLAGNRLDLHLERSRFLDVTDPDAPPRHAQL
jgi:hypothetical protein